MTKCSVQSGHLSPEIDQIVANKASQVAEASNGDRSSGNQALMSSLACFIHHGYITEVEKMWLRNIDLSEVAHASALADVTVTSNVWIHNVVGSIAPIISRIKCPVLRITKMRLCTEDAAALVQAMQTSVEEVLLGVEGDSPELDMDTLLTYDGRGPCGKVLCWGEARERYGDQLATWGENMGWSVRKESPFVVIAREYANIFL